METILEDEEPFDAVWLDPNSIFYWTTGGNWKSSALARARVYVRRDATGNRY